VIQSLILLILWKHEAICHRNFVSTTCSMHPFLIMPFDFTWCYESLFLSLLWKLGRCSSLLTNLKPCSKRGSFSLLLYFYSCFIFLGGLLSPSSVYCKLYFTLSFINPSFFSSETVDHRNLSSFFFFDFSFFSWTDSMPAS